jgi:iron complex transport system substrate-binding protein
MKRNNFLVLMFVLIMANSCSRFGKKETDVTKDIRVVCVSKHLTEMMFALGKGHAIVACDLTSSFPDSAKLLPTVGYHRALNAEGIVSMKPDLVIHSNDIGPAHVLPQLEKLGLRIKTFGAANTFDSAKLVLKELGSFFGVEARADSIIRKMDNEMTAQVQVLRQEPRDTPKVMIIHYGQANNNFFVMSGRNGAADKMILLAGGKPALYDGKGAKQLSAEAIAAANPDIIIATNFGFDKMGGTADQFKQVPGVALTHAAKKNRIYRFEEHDLVYFGPRTPQNVLTLRNLIHPAINAKVN